MPARPYVWEYFSKHFAPVPTLGSTMNMKGYPYQSSQDPGYGYTGMDQHVGGGGGGYKGGKKASPPCNLQRLGLLDPSAERGDLGAGGYKGGADAFYDTNTTSYKGVVPPGYKGTMKGAEESANIHFQQHAGPPPGKQGKDGKTRAPVVMQRRTSDKAGQAVQAVQEDPPRPEEARDFFDAVHSKLAQDENPGGPTTGPRPDNPSQFFDAVSSKLLGEEKQHQAPERTESITPTSVLPTVLSRPAKAQPTPPPTFAQPAQPTSTVQPAVQPAKAPPTKAPPAKAPPSFAKTAPVLLGPTLSVPLSNTPGGITPTMSSSVVVPPPSTREAKIAPPGMHLPPTLPSPHSGATPKTGNNVPGQQSEFFPRGEVDASAATTANFSASADSAGSPDSPSAVYPPEEEDGRLEDGVFRPPSSTGGGSSFHRLAANDPLTKVQANEQLQALLRSKMTADGGPLTGAVDTPKSAAGQRGSSYQAFQEGAREDAFASSSADSSIVGRSRTSGSETHHMDQHQWLGNAAKTASVHPPVAPREPPEIFHKQRERAEQAFRRAAEQADANDMFNCQV